MSELTSELDFERIEADELGVKYLARVEGRTPPPGLEEDCYFQNMKRFTWHLSFLQSFPELRGLSYDAYRSLVLSPGQRRLWGGALQRWAAARHPVSSELGVFSYSVYTERGIGRDDVVEVDGRMKRCAPFARERLVFVPETQEQRVFVERERAALADAGVVTMLPEDLTGDSSHVVYSHGEGYGYLRVVPSGQELGEYRPRDVVIVESAPNDISIVAGLITKNPQNQLSHVNLRLREKGVPNVAVRDVYARNELIELSDQLVHVRVDQQHFVLERAAVEDAEAFWAMHRPTVRAPSANLEVHELATLTQLRAANADAYGAKCANLGELTRVLDAPHRPDGFGIPFVYYHAFMEESGLAAELDTLLAGDLAADASTRRAALAHLRDRIRAATPSAELLQRIATAVDASGVMLRFRSSTNVEDLDTFTGAGLYDSRSGCLADDLDDDAAGPSACLLPEKAAALEMQLENYRAELAEYPERMYLRELITDAEEDLTEEKPVSKVLGKVYASLWNERAFDERAYYGIDHRLAFMGICVHPAYTLERINAVVVSNLRVDAGDPLYRVSSQVGELSVVRPEIPTAVAEALTFRRAPDALVPTDVVVDVHSSLVPEGEQVWPEPALHELTALLFRTHDHFAREVYPNISPLSLDFEVKLERTGAVSIKQVRPYVSRDP